MTQPADDILNGINNRDINAYKVLYKEYYRSLVVYAISFVDQKEIAEDIVQDLFSSIWERSMELQSLVALKAFLYNSVKNRCINHIRHNSVKNKYAEQFLNSPEEYTEFESAMEEEEIYRQLFLAIEELPPRCREIFELNLAGKRNDEIAATLNLSIETVKTQKKKAIRLLKGRISPILFIEISTIILHYK